MNLSSEARLVLDRYQPRDYQLPLLDAIENKGYKRVLAILPRRAGKDITAFNLCVRACLRKPIMCYYIFPTYAQGKKVLFDGLTNEGYRIIDYFAPRQTVESINSQEMKIRFKNGSLFQIVGSDNYDSLVGTNPQACVFSEYALQDPRAYQFIRPILTANDGWALFISTPRGKNHLWELYNLAQNSPEWFTYKLTVNDTLHIPLPEIEKERAEGIMSEDLILQEYYTSFEMGVEGSIYGKYVDRLRMRNQIGYVKWESGHQVHTAWDLGVGDQTCIIFFQVIGSLIRIIDYYDQNNVGLDHYIKVLQEKPYVYGKHIAPHDIKQREFTNGAITRLDKARQLGINFIVCPSIPVEDGIELVRTTIPKLWIDLENCSPLIKAMENYRYEYFPKTNRYSTKPLHNGFSHACDALRYMCIGLPRTNKGTSTEDIERLHHEAWYGTQSQLPPIFRDEFKTNQWNY